MIVTCPVCRRPLGVADRNGRHVASDVHYPRRDGSGKMVCSPPARPDRGSRRTGTAESPSPGVDHR